MCFVRHLTSNSTKDLGLVTVVTPPYWQLFLPLLISSFVYPALPNTTAVFGTCWPHK